MHSQIYKAEAEYLNPLAESQKLVYLQKGKKRKKKNQGGLKELHNLHNCASGFPALFFSGEISH